MITCKTCGHQAITAIFKTVEVTALVLQPGEAEVKAYEEGGMSLPVGPRLERFGLKSSKPLTGLKVEDADGFFCSYCGKKGTVGDEFALVSMCRCGNVTEDLHFCRRYEVLVCEHCRNGYDCHDCSRRNCSFAGSVAPRRSRSRREPEMARVEGPPQPILDENVPPASLSEPFWSEPGAEVEADFIEEQSAPSVQNLDERAERIRTGARNFNWTFNALSNTSSTTGRINNE